MPVQVCSYRSTHTRHTVRHSIYIPACSVHSLTDIEPNPLIDHSPLSLTIYHPSPPIIDEVLHTKYHSEPRGLNVDMQAERHNNHYITYATTNNIVTHHHPSPIKPYFPHIRHVRGPLCYPTQFAPIHSISVKYNANIGMTEFNAKLTKLKPCDDKWCHLVSI